MFSNICNYFFNKSENQKLFFNLNWLIIEKIVRVFFGIYVGALVARYLQPENFGLLNYSIAFVVMYSAFCDFGFDNIILRDLISKKDRKNTILSTAFILKLITGLIGSFLAVITSYILNNNNFELTLVAVTSVSLIFYSFNVIDFWFQSIVKSKFTVISKLIAFTIISLIKIALMMFEFPLIYFAIVYSLEYLMIALFLFIFFYKSNDISFNFSSSYAKSLLKEGFPLLFSSLAILLIMNIDKIMLGKFKGNFEVGIFSIAANLSMMLYFLPVIIGSTFMPSLVENFKKNKKQFDNILNNILGISTILGFIFFLTGLLLAEPVVILLYGLEYSNSAILLSLHLLTFIFVSHVSIRNRVLVIRNKNYLVSIFSILTLMFNVIFNLIFIPKYGGLGAIYASLISWIICTIFVPLFNNDSLTYPILFFKSIPHSLKNLKNMLIKL